LPEAHVLGFELFQASEHSSWGEVVLGIGTEMLAIAMALYWTGSYCIDWWKLVSDHWWLSMPVAGATGLLLVIAQEQSSDWNEVD